MVQYREKGATTKAMVEEAGALVGLCRSGGIPLIVNDRADVAVAVGADGLHVGQDDMPVALARRLIGDGGILGVSAGSPEEARRAAEEGADYIGASPIFATPTKPDASAPLGLDGLRALAASVRGGRRYLVVRHRRDQRSQRGRVFEAGARGIAVVSAIVAATTSRRRRGPCARSRRRKGREMTIDELGEFGLIERIAGILPKAGKDVLVGIGDDVAVLRARAARSGSRPAMSRSRACTSSRRRSVPTTSAGRPWRST